MAAMELFCLTLFSFVIHTYGAIVTVKYQSRSLCNAADRIVNSCYIHVVVNSRIDCFNRCTLSDTCQDVLIVVSDNSCYHGIPCTFQPTCSTYDSNYIYFTSEESSTTDATSMTTTEPPETTAMITEAITTTETHEATTIITTEPPETTTITTEHPETTTITTEQPETTTITTTEHPETTTFTTTEHPETTTFTTTEHPETTTITTTEHPETTTFTTTELPETSTEPPETTTTQEPLMTCRDMLYNDYPKGAYLSRVDLFRDGSVYFETWCRVKMYETSDLQFDFMMSTGMYDLSTLTWDDWVNGFRLGPEDYWLGLETLHQYTNTGTYMVLITIAFDSSSCSGYYTIVHDNFVVQSASNGYRYQIHNNVYVGDYLTCSSSSYKLDSDILRHNEGSRFSTPDNDQDDTSYRHCAQLAGTGWWFSACNPMENNPLGRSFLALAGSPTDQHVTLKGVYTSSSTVRDAIKSVYMSLVLDP